MAKPEVSVAVAMLDATTDHLHQVDAARLQAARSMQRIANELPALRDAFRIMEVHTDYAREGVANVIELRPSLRGRRTDLLPEAA